MINGRKIKIAIFVTHPVQYYVPWYKSLSKMPEFDLTVFYLHKANSEDQSKSGFGVMFNWDLDLYSGYKFIFLNNFSPWANPNSFYGVFLSNLEDYIFENSFDLAIVQGWYNIGFLQILFALNRFSIPILLRGDSNLGTKRGQIWKTLKGYIYKNLFAMSSGALVVGKKNFQYYSFYGLSIDKLICSNHFVDNSFFEKEFLFYRDKRETLKNQCGIAPGSYVFGFVGKLINRKNPLMLLKAFKYLYEKFPNIFLVYVGDGEQRRNIEEIVNNNNLPVSVVGFKNQKEISQFYSIIDCIVLPSDSSETWGLVINEAFNFGVPAIVSDCVGCANDLVVDGETGWVFENNNDYDLICKMEEAIKKSKNLHCKVLDKISEYSIPKANRHLLEYCKQEFTDV